MRFFRSALAPGEGELAFVVLQAGVVPDEEARAGGGGDAVEDWLGVGWVAMLTTKARMRLRDNSVGLDRRLAPY